MAKLWNLPALLVCENNYYGMGTSVQRSSANTEFYTRGDKIPGILMDGLNVFAVREGMRAAKEWSLKNGPLFIEVSTYRYHGHSMSDPGISYRSRDEINEYRQTKDCIERVKGMLLENGFSTEAELKKLEKEIK
mmetsp:Transcript_14634/g.2401  ORF Transcript_14634/g.2401 Transcript_14634/m.2401 type:complete len:134 (+) Transcript_14634:608-1009(+)